jgi:hypothetical protein
VLRLQVGAAGGCECLLQQRRIVLCCNAAGRLVTRNAAHSFINRSGGPRGASRQQSLRMQLSALVIVKDEFRVVWYCTVTPLSRLFFCDLVLAHQIRSLLGNRTASKSTSKVILE